ncbi:MAG: hypothetical protein ACT4P6_02555 [Gemmatimonadaceae bacterium]
MSGQGRNTRRVATILLMGSLMRTAPGLNAQGSSYLALDDSRLRFLEHLIARGDVPDPSPHVRPLLERDVLIALRSVASDTISAAGKMARELLRGWELPLSDNGWWRAGGDVGAQVYSQPRRDLLQPEGTADVQPYAGALLAAGQGPLVGVVRPAYEARLRDDPDYARVGIGGPWKDQARLVEAYIAGQWRWLGVHSGQVQRNWGPSALVGIPISDYAYPRADIGLSIGNRTLRYQMLRTPLYGGESTPGRRWFTAARLDWQVFKGLDVSLWETSILVRPRTKKIDRAIVNPFFIVTFADWFSIRGRHNAIVGGDATWRPTRGLMFQGQIAIDDMSNYGANPYPDRYGFSLLAAGAVGSGTSWRASYAMNSSLAYTSPDPTLSFTQAGIGIGRNFIDNDLFGLSLTMPLNSRWLIQPEAQLLRQGEGTLQRVWPDSGMAVPLLWSGIRRDTWQLGVSAVGHTSGRAGNVQLSAHAGYQLSNNAFHVPGKSETRFVGRLQVTYGWRIGRKDEEPGDPIVSPSALQR